VPAQRAELINRLDAGNTKHAVEHVAQVSSTTTLNFGMNELIKSNFTDVIAILFTFFARSCERELISNMLNRYVLFVQERKKSRRKNKLIGR
jgi:hypothetical protein